MQTLDVYSGDTNALASGEYRLRYTAEASGNDTDYSLTSRFVTPSVSRCAEIIDNKITR